MPVALPSRTPGKTIKTQSILQAAVNMHKGTLDLHCSGHLPRCLFNKFAQVLLPFSTTLMSKAECDTKNGPLCGPNPDLGAQINALEELMPFHIFGAVRYNKVLLFN